MRLIVMQKSVKLKIVNNPDESVKIRGYCAKLY